MEWARIERTPMDDIFASDPMRSDELMLVDGADRQIGAASKERAHREGLLHRAFSVVLVRQAQKSAGASGRTLRPRAAGSVDGLPDEAPLGGGDGVELLLTQRAAGKYHSAGLWANSCCSHPRVGEELLAAARRRLYEELGAQAGRLREIGAFVYRAEFENGLCEYEYDHVLLGELDSGLCPDPAEVGDTRWVSADELAAELAEHPERFAPWAFTVLTLAMRALEAGRI